jgi:hypothetical protein
MTELRKELRVSDEEHRELLGKVNADGVLRQIRFEVWSFLSEITCFHQLD